MNISQAYEYYVGMETAHIFWLANKAENHFDPQGSIKITFSSILTLYKDLCTL